MAIDWDRALGLGAKAFDNNEDEFTTPPKRRGVVDRLFDALQIGNYAVAGGIKGMIDDDPNSGFFEGFGEGIKAGNPFGQGYEKGEVVFSDVLGEAGWNPETGVGKVARGVVGFAGDVLLDPLTYINPFSAAGKVLKGTGTVVKGKTGVQAVKGLTTEQATDVINKFYSAKGVNVETLDPAIYKAEIEGLRDSFNKKIMKVRSGGEDLQFGMKNLPFTEKIKVGNKTLDTFNKSLIKADKLRQFGDKTVAPYVNAGLQKMGDNPLLKKFNKNADFIEKAKTDPMGAAVDFKLEKAIKGMDLGEITKDFDVANFVNKMRDETASWTKEETHAFMNAYQEGHYKKYFKQKAEVAKKADKIRPTAQAVEKVKAQEKIVDEYVKEVQKAEGLDRIVPETVLDDIHEPPTVMKDWAGNDVEPDWLDSIIMKGDLDEDIRDYVFKKGIVTDETLQAEYGEIMTKLQSFFDEFKAGANSLGIRTTADFQALVAKDPDLGVKFNELVENARTKYGLEKYTTEQLLDMRNSGVPKLGDAVNEGFVGDAVKASDDLDTNAIDVLEDLTDDADELNAIDNALKEMAEADEVIDESMLTSAEKQGLDYEDIVRMTPMDLVRSEYPLEELKKEFMTGGKYKEDFAGNVASSMRIFPPKNSGGNKVMLKAMGLHVDDTVKINAAPLQQALDMGATNRKGGDSYTSRLYRGARKMVNQDLTPEWIAWAANGKHADLVARKNRITSLISDFKAESYDKFSTSGKVMYNNVETTYEDVLNQLNNALENVNARLASEPNYSVPSKIGIKQQSFYITDKGNVEANVRRLNKLIAELDKRKQKILSDIEDVVEAKKEAKQRSVIEKKESKRMSLMYDLQSIDSKIADIEYQLKTPEKMRIPSEKIPQFAKDYVLASDRVGLTQSMDDIVASYEKLKATLIPDAKTTVDMAHNESVKNAMQSLRKQHLKYQRLYNMSLPQVEQGLSYVADALGFTGSRKQKIEQLARMNPEFFTKYEDVVQHKVHSLENQAFGSKAGFNWENPGDEYLKGLREQNPRESWDIRRGNGEFEGITGMLNKSWGSTREQLSDLRNAYKELDALGENEGLRRAAIEAGIADMSRGLPPGTAEQVRLAKDTLAVHKIAKEVDALNAPRVYKSYDDIVAVKKILTLLDEGVYQVDAELVRNLSSMFPEDVLTMIRNARVKDLDYIAQYVDEMVAKQVKSADAKVTGEVANKFQKQVPSAKDAPPELVQRVRTLKGTKESLKTAEALKAKMMAVSEEMLALSDEEYEKLMPVYKKQLDDLNAEYDKVIAQTNSQTGTYPTQGEGPEEMFVHGQDDFSLTIENLKGNKTREDLDDIYRDRSDTDFYKMFNDENGTLGPAGKNNSYFENVWLPKKASLSEPQLRQLRDAWPVGSPERTLYDALYKRKFMDGIGFSRPVVSTIGNEPVVESIAEAMRRVKSPNTVQMRKEMAKQGDFTFANALEEVKAVADDFVPAPDITEAVKVIEEAKGTIEDVGPVLSETAKINLNDEKFVKMAEAISAHMGQIAKNEVRVGKLKTGQARMMRGQYLPHILSDEARSWIVKHVSKEYEDAAGFNPQIFAAGYEKEFNKGRKFLTIQEANEAMFKKTGVHKWFNESLVDMVQARSFDSNRLVYNTEMTSAVRALAGIPWEEGVKKEGYTAVVPFVDLNNALNNLYDGKIPEEAFKALGLEKRFFTPNNAYINMSDEQIRNMFRMFNTGKIQTPKPFMLDNVMMQRLNKESMIQKRMHTNDLLNVYDKFLIIYKMWNSAINPGFHFQNTASNAFQSFMANGASVLDPKTIGPRYKEAYKIMENVSPDKMIKIGDTEITHGQLRYMAEKYGILSNTFYRHDVRFGMNDTGYFQKKGLNPKYDPTNVNEFGLYKAGARVGADIEGTQRLVLFIDSLNRGMGVEEAVENVNKFLFDYGDLTNFEKEVMKRAIPFYTFMRKNVPLQLEQMLENPNLYRNLDKAFDEIERMSGEEYIPDSERNEWHDDAIQMPFKLGGKRFGINPQLPYQQLDRITPQRILGQSTPLIKTPIEVGSGQYIYTGMDIEGPIDYLLNQTTPTKTANIAGKKEGVSGGAYVASQLGGFPINILE